MLSGEIDNTKEPLIIHHYYDHNYQASPRNSNSHRLVGLTEEQFFISRDQDTFKEYTEIVEGDQALFPDGHIINRIVESLLYQQGYIMTDPKVLNKIYEIIKNSSKLVYKENLENFKSILKYLDEIKEVNREEIQKSKEEIKDFLDCLKDLEKQKGKLAVSFELKEKFANFDPVNFFNGRNVIEKLSDSFDYIARYTHQKEIIPERHQKIIGEEVQKYEQKLRDLQNFEALDYKYLKKLAQQIMQSSRLSERNFCIHPDILPFIPEHEATKPVRSDLAIREFSQLLLELLEEGKISLNEDFSRSILVKIKEEDSSLKDEKYKVFRNQLIDLALANYGYKGKEEFQKNLESLSLGEIKLQEVLNFQHFDELFLRIISQERYSEMHADTEIQKIAHLAEFTNQSLLLKQTFADQNLFESMSELPESSSNSYPFEEVDFGYFEETNITPEVSYFYDLVCDFAKVEQNSESTNNCTNNLLLENLDDSKPLKLIQLSVVILIKRLVNSNSSVRKSLIAEIIQNVPNYKIFFHHQFTKNSVSEFSQEYLEKAFNNLDRAPKAYDAVLGGENPGPKMYDAVLGGLTPEKHAILKQERDLQNRNQELNSLTNILGLS